MTKTTNQHYFNKESKAMYYVLGAWYGCGNSITKKTRKKDGSFYEYKAIKFQSKTKNLVEIVRAELESDNKIIRDPRKDKHSYWFEAMGVPTLCDKLEELGVDKPKRKGEFPEIPEEYISHFVRGFFDARVGIYRSDNKTQIKTRFNPKFLKGLRNVLEKYAHVEGGGTEKNILLYSTANVARIHDFIYEDWQYIKRKGLYLPFKKRRLQSAHTQLQRVKIVRQQFQNRIEKAKRVLEQGGTITKAASTAGYAYYTALYRSFKNVIGMTPGDYRLQHARKDRK